MISTNIRILGELYRSSPIRFPIRKNQDFRYYCENDMFSYIDAIMFSLWIQYLRPKNIIEVGSGFSSCVMLDTCEKAKLDVKLMFIEPNAERLQSLMGASPLPGLIEKCVQEVEEKVFEILKKTTFCLLIARTFQKLVLM